jgi:hypothetical protein
MTDTIETVTLEDMLAEICGLDDVIEAHKRKIEDHRKGKSEAEDKRRAFVDRAVALMEATGCTKTEAVGLQWATCRVPPKPVVSNPDAVPDAWCRFTRVPDLSAIRTAIMGGHSIPGVTLGNGGLTLARRELKPKK